MWERLARFAACTSVIWDFVDVDMVVDSVVEDFDDKKSFFIFSSATNQHYRMRIDDYTDSKAGIVTANCVPMTDVAMRLATARLVWQKA
jgi:hypothetical protein